MIILFKPEEPWLLKPCARHSRMLSPGASLAHCAGYDVAGIQ